MLKNFTQVRNTICLTIPKIIGRFLDRLEDIAPGKTFGCTAVCNACNKTFVKYSNLMRHVKQYHPGKPFLSKY